YYQALRQEQTLQAELDAVNQRNEQIDAENKQLETDEGVENQAREEYGWVKDDEKATVVVNSGDSGSGDMPSQVDGSKIEPPHTWYYDILDIIFRAEV
ncbi:MAG: septum formation initiator family protein, partial [Coriobacteriaceae bacterium]|nr:septum formation initiator family protein [Coriobacteriaceae bacterium]